MDNRLCPRMTGIAGRLAVLLVTAGCTSATAPLGQIAFESYRDGNAEVYLMEADGSGLVNLTSNPAYDGTPSWAPNGQQIAFTSERGGSPDIHVMDWDGANATRLTDGRGFNVVPAWSPDGSQILFVSNRDYRVPVTGGQFEVEANAKLWVIDADGTNLSRRTSLLGLDMYGTWSPDGESIAYMGVREGNPEIYVLGSDKVEVNVTNHPDQDLNPAWSPDGTKIAFMSDRGGDMEIYVLDLLEESLTNLTQNPANDGDPAWSPDGSRIAFTSDRYGNIEIHIMDADGSRLQRLTSHPDDDIHPQWRPQPG